MVRSLESSGRKWVFLLLREGGADRREVGEGFWLFV